MDVIEFQKTTFAASPAVAADEGALRTIAFQHRTPDLGRDVS